MVINFEHLIGESHLGESLASTTLSVLGSVRPSPLRCYIRLKTHHSFIQHKKLYHTPRIYGINHLRLDNSFNMDPAYCFTEFRDLWSSFYGLL